MLPRVPFLGFALSFCVGILLGKCIVPTSGYSIGVVAGGSLFAFAWAVWFYVRKSARIAYALAGCTLLLGLSVYQLHEDKRVSALLIGDLTMCEGYEARITSLPEKRKKSWRIEGIITKLKLNGQWQNQQLKVLISLPLDVEVMPDPGQYMVIAGAPERPLPPLNPDEFDYQGFLWNKGILWVDYVHNNSYHVFPGYGSRWSLLQGAISVSRWADKVFRIHIQDDRAYGLVKAMLLGRRDDLGADQIQDYISSGTVHILSVSGMHVAIIFLVLSKMLSWLKRLKGGKYIYLFSLAVLLFFYALVTGLPPSVQRATLMCLVLIIAETFGRKQVSLNTLAISALLILVVDPHALFDLGFQLSFLAMAGIFLFYEPIESIWRPDHFLPKYVWQITALSLAAQLATFPISLYYFHQFPFYFWLINPFVIFFTNILLPAAMALLLVSLSPFTGLQWVVEKVVQWSAFLTNKAVAIPEILPGYLLNNLSINAVEVVLLYIFMLVLWLAYERRQFWMIRYAAAVGIVFVIYSVSLSIQCYYTSSAVVHAVPRHAVISFKEGDRLYVLSDSLFTTDSEAYQFRIKNYAINQGVLETVYINQQSFVKGEDLLVRKVRKGFVANWQGKSISMDLLPTGLTDYTLISEGYPKDNIPGAQSTVFMLGGQMRGKKQVVWKQYFADNKYAFYDLNQGALLLH